MASTLIALRCLTCAFAALASKVSLSNSLYFTYIFTHNKVCLKRLSLVKTELTTVRPGWTAGLPVLYPLVFLPIINDITETKKTVTISGTKRIKTIRSTHIKSLPELPYPRSSSTDILSWFRKGKDKTQHSWFHQFLPAEIPGTNMVGIPSYCQHLSQVPESLNCSSPGMNTV